MENEICLRSFYVCGEWILPQSWSSSWVITNIYILFTTVVQANNGAESFLSCWFLLSYKEIIHNLPNPQISLPFS